MPTLHADVNRALIAPAQPPHQTGHDVVVRYRMTAPAVQSPDKARLPLHIGLVIDRSGSMSGSKLTDAVDACRRIIQRMNALDRCTVVTFDNNATTLIDGQLVTDAWRTLMMHALDGVSPGGSTNLSGGLQMAGNLLLEKLQQQAGVVNHIMLLTDGMANQGITDIATLEQIARDYHNRGIGISTYGLGQGYAEESLRRIAEAGQGTHQFIEQSSDIDRYFSTELSELFTVAYRDVQLQINVPAGFGMEVLGNLPNTMINNTLTIPLGTMVAHEQRNVYVLMSATQVAVPSQHALMATLRGTTNTNHEAQAQCGTVINVAAAQQVGIAPLDTAIEQEAVMVDIAHVRSVAQQINRGRTQTAAEAHVLQMQARSDVFARYTIYRDLANEMRQVIDNWHAKSTESTMINSTRMRTKDVHLLREKRAMLMRRGIEGTEISMLNYQIERLERMQQERDDESR